MAILDLLSSALVGMYWVHEGVQSRKDDSIVLQINQRGPDLDGLNFQGT